MSWGLRPRDGGPILGTPAPTDPAWHSPSRRRAVVVGGGLAGMLAARVLAGAFDQVTVLDRDRFPATPSGRKGLPQARHTHALLARGLVVLERLLPGLTRELLHEGALLDDFGETFAWLTPFGWGPRFRSGIRLLSCSRDLIDWGVRRRVAALPNVRIRQDADVAGLVSDRGGLAVVGARLRTRPGQAGGADGEEKLAADLVAVADGRNSRLPGWLEALGHEAPAETVVNPFLGYASRLYRPPQDFRPGWTGLYVQAAPPGHLRGGLLVTVEGGRWLVTLIGIGGDYPPADEAGFMDFARSLRSPAVYEAIRQAEPLTPITGYRATENRLRHYERLRRWPEGLVVLGDAACAFDPVYGQGMTAAALGAETLDRCLRQHGGPSGPRPGLGRAFQRRLARANAVSWQLSTSADYRVPGVEGPPPGRATRLMNRYVDRVIRLSTRHEGVRRRVLEVLQLLRPPSALLSPGMLGRVAWAWLTGGAADKAVTVWREAGAWAAAPGTPQARPMPAKAVAVARNRG